MLIVHCYWEKQSCYGKLYIDSPETSLFCIINCDCNYVFEYIIRRTVFMVEKNRDVYENQSVSNINFNSKTILPFGYINMVFYWFILKVFFFFFFS